MKRDIVASGGIAGSVWAFFEFGFVHAPELLTVVGPLGRLAESVAWLPVAPLEKARMVVLALVVLYGVYRLADSARERFNL